MPLSSGPFLRLSGRSLPPGLMTWLGRTILTVGAPLLFFGILEGLLHLFGFGVRTDFFIPDSMPGFYRTNRDFTAPFLPAHFGIHPVSFRLTKHKNADAVRIFVLGESAALGDPNPSFGLAAQLQAQLSAHYPGKKIEVYNLGIVAINSHVVYQIVREIAPFEPDLLVIYMGNNEVVGPNGPGSFYSSFMPPLAAIRASYWARGTRVGQLISFLLERFGGQGPRPQEWRGMELFLRNTVRGNDPRLAAVYRNFESNLQGCVEHAAQDGIKIILATVVANYCDFSPFVSMHGASFSPDRLRAFQSAFDEGMLAWDLEDRTRALVRFESVLAMDPEYALTHYVLGRIEEELGNLKAARKYFADALHWDALRFRPDAPINQVIRKVAKRHSDTVLLVDAAGEMGGDLTSSVEPAGRKILFEHVHFNWAGNYQLARRLAETCANALSPHNKTTAPWLDSLQCAEALGCTDFEMMMTKVRVYQLISKHPFAGQFFYGEELTRLGREIRFTNDRIAMAGGVSAEQEKEERVLRQHPQDAEFATRRVILESELGHFEHALQLIEETRALVPESPFIFVTQKAKLLGHLNRYQEAEKLLLESIEGNPDYFQAGDALVDICSRTGQFEKGRLFFEHLLEKSPRNDRLRMALGRLHLLSGNFRGAVSESLAVLKRDPGNEAALELAVQSQQQLGDELSSVALMQEVQKAQPYNIKNYQRLIEIFTKQGDKGKVVDLLKSMAETNPADAAFHLDLAHRYFELNRRQQTLVELGKAKRLAKLEENVALIKAIDSLLHNYAQYDGHAEITHPIGPTVQANTRRP